MTHTTEPLPTPQLVDALVALRAEIDATRAATPTGEVHPSFAEGAANLGDYVVLRRHDLRPVQLGLAGMGLSSLGRAEADVSRTLDRVLAALDALQARGVASSGAGPSRASLDEHTDALFGPPPAGRRVRVMVTASTDLADDPARVRDLIEAGMDVLRVNCAHDTPERWRRMAENVRAASAATGRRCQVLMDLPGPKLRTGAMLPGPAVRDWHPERDELGRVVRPVRVWLGNGAPLLDADASLPLAPGSRHTRLRVDDTLRVRDARGRDRDLRVLAVTGSGVLALSDRSAWVESGAPLWRVRRGRRQPIGAVGDLPPIPGGVLLSVDDELFLRADAAPGRPAEGERPASVPCTLPEVFGAVRVGQPVLFDDGKVEGVIVAIEPQALRVRITRAREGGVRLGPDKGINLPETRLPLPALTPHDLACLDHVAALADLVGLSFVRTATDVADLRRALAERGGEGLGVVLKIETRHGFENLPTILREGMRGPRLGVMIARGDLAVECGFERLAELQEEILWVCEAAHVPAIWATQVLDTLARKGVATRAEITDAAFGQRAECVMLNKGPHAVEAVRALADILTRMAAHHRKKTAMLRPLRSLGAPDVSAPSPGVARSSPTRSAPGTDEAELVR